MAFEPRFPEWKSRAEHEHYAELCALFTSGSLTDDELAELNAHLRVCQSCAQLLSSYRAVAKSVSSLAPVSNETVAPEKPAWLENARKRLFNSIEAGRAAHQPQLVYQRPAASRNSSFMFKPFALAAAVLLAGFLAGFAYHLGQVRGRQAALQSATTVEK